MAVLYHSAIKKGTEGNLNRTNDGLKNGDRLHPACGRHRERQNPVPDLVQGLAISFSNSHNAVRNGLGRGHRLGRSQELLFLCVHSHSCGTSTLPLHPV